MENNKLHFIFFSLIFFAALHINAQNLLHASGKAIVNENQDTIILRGMGLGGWMLQEGYMLQTAGFANAQHKIRNKIEELIGEADTDLFYEAWLANHCRKADIDSLKAWGFNSVRLPMHYNLYTLPIEDEPIPGQNTWLEKGFEMTDSLISWCAQNEMWVILDLHAAPGGQGQDEGISDYDPNKPSLWESDRNKQKTIDLWQRIAARYVDEQWVAGYDLLNEPNWNLPGGTALKNLYVGITNAIRAVDTKHILFIEGNWFANDFTGLTPPWDDNLVYAPHKYWSINDQGSIQWVLNIRNTYNVPLYLGESGENSNVWFRDAIKLLEDNDIGWAWWPMKKIESVAGPLSVEKTTQYQTLLDYWSNGGTAPSAAFAKATLMEITELLKIENCFFQKDVIDAMFRQVNSNETRPFKDHTIPGLVMATNYDMGVIGEAYFDVESANYQVSTGTFTSWNNGWRYRNDGVDIDVCNDNINTNGYAVAWIDDGEWMQYEVEVTSEAVYDINVRVAAGVSGGSFHFMAGDSDISIPFYVSNTGGWQTWITRTVPNVILGPNDNKIKFFANQSGFNVSSFEFVEKGPTTELENIFVSAITVDENTIQLNVNKYLEDNLTSLPANFEIFANGTSLPITNIVSAPNNARILYFTVDHTMNSTETLRISYNGNNINATDGTALTTFIQKDVKNTLFFIHPIPGKVEAEEYFEMSGIQLENTSDNGGGQNIGYLDPEDYIDYKIAVSTSGIYQIDYRTASEISNGSIDLQLVSENGEVNTIASNHNFSLTGGWQTWSTTSHQVQLPAGIQTLRIKINQAPFNLNWFDLNLLMATNILTQNLTTLKVFPNPSNDIFQLELGLKNALDTKLEIRDFSGQLIYAKDLENTLEIKETISLSDFPNGIYLLSIITNDGELHTEKLVKISQ